MTTISALSSVSTATANTKANQQQNVAQSASVAADTVPATSQPIDTVSISSAATTAAAAPSIGEADPDTVEDALYDVSGANGFVSNLDNSESGGDYALIAQKFGEAAAEQNYEDALNAATGSQGFAATAATALGISVTSSVSSTAVADGANPGQLNIANFSFTNAGSTYSVTNGPDGTLVGTKDGQAWQTLQIGQATDQYSNVVTETSTGVSILTELFDTSTGKAVSNSGSASSINIAA